LAEEASEGYLLYLAVKPNVSLLTIRLNEPNIRSILDALYRGLEVNDADEDEMEKVSGEATI